MSNTYFSWMPQLLDYQETNSFKTKKTTFENGMEQRRYVWTRPIGTWTFRYEMLHIKREQFVQTLDQIYLFHVARKGSYDNFWIPSWRLETVLASPASTSTIILSNSPINCGFVSTPYEQGNFVFLTSSYSLHTDDSPNCEVRRIVSISGNQMVLDKAVNNTYASGAKVMKAYKVTFGSDSFERSYLNPYAYQADVQFVEDVAGYSEALV